MIRLAVMVCLVTAALGSPTDPLLDRVLRHKRQLQLRSHASPVSGDGVLDVSRLSRKLEDFTAPPAGASASGRQVRLVGGPGPWEGAVEVHTASGWHRVVANRWSEAEASVVCRELGFVSYFMSAPLPTSGRLSLDDTDAAPVSVHKCSGREASLLDCDRAEVEVGAETVGVSCLNARDLSERCGEGELPFADSCYYIGRERVTRLKAELRCRQRNASLVVVNSQLKNDFLSGVISSEGLEGFHTAGQSHRLGKRRTIWSWGDSDAPFLFSNWNPAEPLSTPVGVTQRCLTLEQREAAPASDRDYAFWSSSDCSRRLQYVCETPRDWTDCARGAAGSYAGSVSTAESGRPCLPWSEAAGLPGLRSAALESNFCRNPDGDLRPWCFTGPDQFEYCDIAACPPHLPTPPPKEDNYTCHSLQFACGDGRCVKITYVCDGDRDCADGRDETICDRLSANFQTFVSKDVKFPSSASLDEVVALDSGRSERSCQVLCLADPSCYAVSYIVLKRTCLRILRPLGEFRLNPSLLVNTHVVLDRYTPCAGHRCDDFECLNRTDVRCNGVNDCSDISDELNCGAVSPVPLRLVGGDAAAGSGRLEARFLGRWGAVCDDGFNSRVADVACRQLGFRRHRRLFVNGRGYPADVTGADFAISFAACNGNEDQIADCVLQYKQDRCTAGEHVSLECTNQPGTCTLLPNFFECLDSSACVAPSELCDGERKCADGSDESEDVCSTLRTRLVPTDSAGPPRVEVKPAGSQRPPLSVTSRAFTQEAANFLCRSLGDRPYGLYMEDAAPLPEREFVAEVLCSDAVNCSIGVAVPGSGAHAVRLSCQTERPPPPQLRLVGGDERSGLLELQPPLRGWGRVCATTFSAAQAEVVCRELGFGGQSMFLEASRNPEMTVSLRGMDCLGDEESIIECFRLPWSNSSGSEVCGGSGEVYLSCNVSSSPPPAAPLTPQCAAAAADLSRVLNGRTGQVPAFAQLQLGGSRRRLRCGATVISERFLLTAAHCVKRSVSDRLKGVFDLPVTLLLVVLGDGQRVAVRRVIPHPGHRLLGRNTDDLALVELDRSVRFSAAVQPACLPPADVSYSPGLACSVAGYGGTSPRRGSSDGDSVEPSDTLQVGNVTFFTREECQSFYGRRNVTQGTVCAGDERFQVDTCDGDSGGPLLCRLGENSVLMGVTSWGPGCGVPRQPGVYVRVASYLPWIRANMQGPQAA